MPNAVTVKGNQALIDRFKKWMGEGLSGIQSTEASRLATAAHGVYYSHAPYRAASEGLHFRDTFTTSHSANAVTWHVEVDTDNPDLRQWLQEGTGFYGPEHHRIYGHGALGPVFNWSPLFPSAATFASSKMTGMRFFASGGGGAGPFFWRSIAGMRPNPWEGEAESAAVPLGTATAGRIAQRSADYLTGVSSE